MRVANLNRGEGVGQIRFGNAVGALSCGCSKVRAGIAVVGGCGLRCISRFSKEET